MPLCPSHVADLNLALDEALVQRVRWDVFPAQVRLMLRVLALPPGVAPQAGEAPDLRAAPDVERDLVLHGASRLRVLLRRDRSGSLGYGPPVPLAGQAELEEFFSSLSESDAMHDGKPLDDASPTDDWPDAVSLTVDFPRSRGGHTLYWFAECARDEPGGMVGYCLEGLVTFDDLTVHGRDGRCLSLDEFVDDNRRWWAARTRSTSPSVPV